MSEEDLLIIKGHEVESILRGREADIVESVRSGYELHGQGRSSLPHSVFLRFPEQEQNRIIALPAYLGGDFDLAGMKWISSFPANTRNGVNRASAVIVLNSAVTGRPNVLLEGSWISAKRTAASAALAAQHLVDGSGPTGIIGCGVINFEVIRFLHASDLSREAVVLFDTDQARAETFRGKCAEQFPELQLEISTDVKQLLARCKLVSIATTASKPHLQDISACQPGTVLLHVSLRDLSPEVILQCENIVDDVDHVCRAQTSIHLAEQQTGNRNFIACTLPDVLLGKSRRRTTASGVTIFSPFGLGILDLALAALTRDLALVQGVGQTIENFLL
jgi:N-[(2S)-2-amino-2-carboxyethyl]-L-glutamate dehydrogenase